MTHWQTQHGRTFLCGETRLVSEGRDYHDHGICLDSFCDHCGNLRDEVDCPACLTAAATALRVLTGDVPPPYEPEEP